MTLPWVVGGVVACLAAYWVFMSPYSQAFGRYPYRGDRRDRSWRSPSTTAPTSRTSQIADYLCSKHIRATFFQVGKCVERFPETTAKMYAAGHSIGNHSLAHQFHAYLRPGRLAREVAQTQEILAAGSAGPRHCSCHPGSGASRSCCGCSGATRSSPCPGSSATGGGVPARRRPDRPPCHRQDETRLDPHLPRRVRRSRRESERDCPSRADHHGGAAAPGLPVRHRRGSLNASVIGFGCAVAVE